MMVTQIHTHVIIWVYIMYYVLFFLHLKFFLRTCSALLVVILNNFFLLLLVGCMHNTEPGADNICTDGSVHIRGEYSTVIFFLKHIKFNVLGIR